MPIGKNKALRHYLTLALPTGSRREAGFVVSLALASGAIAVAITLTTLQGIPHVSDEISYNFQARIFASGRLWLDPPPLPDLFRQQNVILDAGRWCSKYPPGWPLLLTSGWLAGIPWAVAPLLLALSVVGVWQLGRVLFDKRTGMLSAAALAASPFALLMGASSMAHIPSLCSSVWCLVALCETAERPRLRTAVIAGLLGGMAFLIRPYTAVTLLSPAAVWCLWRAQSKRSTSVRPWDIPVGLGLGFLPFLLLFLAYNWLVFGGPLVTGYSIYGREGAAGLPVGPSSKLLWYFVAMNHSLWGWPWPNLIVLLPLVWPRPRQGREAMLIACAAGIVVGHSFYYYFDVVYGGPRLVFEVLGPLSVCTARALLALRGAISHLLDAMPGLSARANKSSMLVISAAAGLLLLAFPLAGRLPHELERHGQWYHGQSTIPLQEAAQAGLGNDALVFVAGPPWVFGSFFLKNALDPLDGQRVFVRDLPGAYGQVVARIHRRETWRVIVDLEPLPGPNAYADTFHARRVVWARLQ